jgi:hypothetical protein
MSRLATKNCCGGLRETYKRLVPEVGMSICGLNLQNQTMNII